MSLLARVTLTEVTASTVAVLAGIAAALRALYKVLKAMDDLKYKVQSHDKQLQELESKSTAVVTKVEKINGESKSG